MDPLTLFCQDVYNSAIKEKVLTSIATKEGRDWITIAELELRRNVNEGGQPSFNTEQADIWKGLELPMKLNLLTSTYINWKTGISKCSQHICNLHDKDLIRFSRVPEQPVYSLNLTTPKELYISTFSKKRDNAEELSLNFDAGGVSAELLCALNMETDRLNVGRRRDEEYSIWFWSQNMLVEVRDWNDEGVRFPVHKELVSRRIPSAGHNQSKVKYVDSSSEEDDLDKDEDFRPNRTHSAVRRIAKSTCGLASSRVTRRSSIKNQT